MSTKDSDGQEARMMKSKVRKMIAQNQELLSMIKENMDVEEWVQNKIVLASHNIDSVYDYMKYSSDPVESESVEDPDSVTITLGLEETIKYSDEVIEISLTDSSLDA